MNGYVSAGVFCAIVSHPADTIVSKLNQQKGSSIMEVARKLGFAGETYHPVEFVLFDNFYIVCVAPPSPDSSSFYFIICILSVPCQNFPP